MIELRDYQQRAIVEIDARLKAHRRVVAVAPTGSGKTVIGAAFVATLPPKKRVLWIAHRVELLRQARDGLSAAGIADLGMLSGPEKANIGARVLVASIDTLRSRAIPNVDLIVVDEAHRIEAKSYQKVIAARPNALVLGLTATPWRLDGKGLGDTFADMFVVAKPSELFEAGHLARPVTYGVGEDRAREIVKGLKSNKGDFTSRGLGAAMMKVLVGSVVTEWETHARGMQTIVFASGRDHGQQLTRDFVARGHVAEYIDGDTPPAERDAILARLRSKETRIVVNVDVLSEGFDCPAVNCVSLARPTKSRSRFLQYVGRALRPYDGQPVILDHTGNCLRFGAPDADQWWSLDGRASDGGNDAPVKCCAACSAMIPAGAKECPICASVQPLERAEVERLEAERLDELRSSRKANGRRECKVCGVSFDAPRGSIARGFGMFCGRDCHRVAQREHRVVRPCETCGKELSVSPSLMASGKRRFCGRACVAAARSARVPRACVRCGKTFHVVPSREDKYCGRECQNVPQKSLNRTCETCGKWFTVYPSAAAKGVGKHCGNVCRYAAKRVAKVAR